MNDTRRIAGLVILILLTSLIQWPQATAITPQDQTISITDTHDDLFITETGIGIDSQLCHILDPTMDIRSFLVFRELEINYWEPLENATLRFRTTATLDFDADSSVTVYGMRSSDLQLEGVLNPGWVLSVPLTSAHVNVNTSQFYGQTWHEINVTNIVEELIRSYDWDGDGADGTETGDAIGFIIYGDEGYDTRWFIDYLYGTPSLAPQLVIHWNHEPPPPPDMPGDAEYNETLGNYTIWSLDPILDENRTGDGADVNWNMINQTQLSEHDSGACLTVNNATWATAVGAHKSYTLSLYNDTGASNVNSYFLRFAINVTDVFTSEAGNDPIPFIFALSTSTPTVTDGMAYSTIGDWIGLIGIVNPDDHQWRVWIRERQGAADVLAGASPMYSDESPVMLYFECFINMTVPYITYSIYNDPEFTDLNVTQVYEPVWATGPFRYAQTVAGIGQATTGQDSFEFYTYLDYPPWWPTTTWYVHETDVCNVTGPFDTYNNATDWIDTENPDPEDPDPGGEWSTGPGGETGAFTRFRMRLWFLLIGFGCLFGPVLFFAWRQPSGYYIMCGAIVMLIGIGLLISIGQV